MRFLTEEQLVAVEMLAGGSTDSEAAKAAGVHRVTINRWKHLPIFRAALNRRCERIAEELAREKRAVFSQALSTVNQAIAGGDAALAMTFLRFADAAATKASGPMSEGEVIADEAFKRSRAELIAATLSDGVRETVEVDLVLQGEETPGGLDLNQVTEPPPRGEGDDSERPQDSDRFTDPDLDDEAGDDQRPEESGNGSAVVEFSVNAHEGGALGQGCSDL